MKSRRKFQIGDLVVGRDEAPASFRERRGIVKEFVQPGEYGVLFEDGRFEYVMSWWIRAA